MLTIERLKLQLPDGFEHRSENILRLMADQLAQLDIGFNAELSAIHIPPIEMNAVWSDDEVARQLTHAIDRGVRNAIETDDHQQRGGHRQ